MTNGSGGLLHSQLGGSLGQLETGGTHGYCRRGDQDHFVTIALEIGQHPDQLLHSTQVQCSTIMGEG